MQRSQALAGVKSKATAANQLILKERPGVRFRALLCGSKPGNRRSRAAEQRIPRDYLPARADKPAEQLERSR